MRKHRCAVFTSFCCQCSTPCCNLQEWFKSTIN